MKKQLTLLLFIAIAFNVTAQSIQEQLIQKHVTCYDVYSNAGDLLPELYESRSFDSIQVALAVVQQYCDSSYAPLLYLQILLSIQQSRFSINQLPQDEKWEEFLQSYTFTFRTLRQGGYEVNKYSYYHYNDAEKKIYNLVQFWAKDLLAQGRPDNNQTFICSVLAGNVKNPQATIKSNRTKYPELYALLRKGYAAERNQPDGNAAFTSGVWLPAGKAKLLGVHPTAGFQAGGRNKHNEVDLTMNFRFVSADNSYTFFRKDSLYSTKHFFGGYIGLDYTRYLIHTTNFELGLTGGIGYDGFDITNEPKKDDHSKDYLKPYSINSLNLNAGPRFNYYFNPHFYIGLGGRYNKVNYKNTGGTSLKGNTVSLDFFIGG